jgi:putative membrane-bound dehydrogenase-like protein
MRHALLGLLLLSAPVFAQREYGFDNRKPSGQEYLTPEETVKRMKVAPEFEVKLFAGEPNCVNPIAFTIDEKGRVWVVECFEYPSRTPKGKAPRDRIVILEDTDGDGACDKRTVFAEGKDFPVTDERKKAGLGAFDLASGIEVGHGGVYVGAPPYLWFIENKNDKPGKFETVLKGFGSEDTHETLNTFQWGPDGWLYGLHGVFTQSNVKPLDGPETRMNAAVWRFHPKTKKFEIFAEGTSNPWGMDWRNTDGQFILACCVIPHLYHIVPGGIYKRQAGASYNPHAYDHIKEICDHTFHKESGWAHAGLISLDAPHIPEKYRNSVIFGSIHGCSVKQNVLKPNGSSFTASRGDDFLVSGDKNFRPINLKWGPNGDIYLIDWHDQNPCHQAKPDSWDYERGRVYRIQVKGTKAKKAEDLGDWNQTQLMQGITSADPYKKRTCLRLLHQTEPKVDPKQPHGDGFAGVAMIEAPKQGHLSYLWMLMNLHGPADKVGWLEAELSKMYVRELGRFQNEHPASAGWAVRFGADNPGADTVENLTKAAEHAPVAVRRELASAAIRLAEKHDVAELVRALMKHKEDATDPLIPHLTWLAYEKVISKKDGAVNRAEKELAFLAKEAPDNIFVRDQIVPKVMRRLVATGQPDDLKLCVKFLADVTDVNTREKALDGLAVALAGQTVDAPDNWKALQPELRKDNRLAGLTNKLAVSFRDPEAVKRALDALRNASLADAERAEAVRQLTLLKAKDGDRLFLTVLRQGFPLPVKVEAARGLVAFDKPGLAKELLAGWKLYAPPLKAELVNTLASRQPWAVELLKAMQSKAVDRTEVTDTAITKMEAFRDKQVNDLIATAWGRTRPTPAELNRLIDKTRASLSTGSASFAAGKKVFENQCGKCHKFDGKGAEVGPALDGAGRDIEYLLANVLDPNRVVGAPYFVRTATLLDGQVIQGLLHAEDDQSITLKTENAVLKRIAKKDLDGPVKVAEKSMMPEGLAGGMTEQDFRDLIRYVMANPFVAKLTVDGKEVVVPVTGRIALPETKGAGEATLLIEVDAAVEMKTELLLGGTAVFTVKHRDRAYQVGSEKEAPDLATIPLTLTKGKNLLSVRVVYKGGVYVRFLDPDRKLSYPEK